MDEFKKAADTLNDNDVDFQAEANKLNDDGSPKSNEQTVDDNEEEESGHVEESGEEESKKKRLFNEDEMSEIVRKRVNQKQAKIDELEQQLKYFQSSLQNMGTQGMQGQMPLQDGQQQPQMQQQSQFQNPADILQQWETAKNMSKMKQFFESIQNAQKEDPEFNTLVQQDDVIDMPLASQLAQIDNSLPLTKHLLKDPEDMVKVLSASPDKQMGILRALNKKVQASIQKPRPSGFNPPGELNSTAAKSSSAFDDDDISALVKDMGF